MRLWSKGSLTPWATGPVPSSPAHPRISDFRSGEGYWFKKKKKRQNWQGLILFWCKQNNCRTRSGACLPKNSLKRYSISGRSHGASAKDTLQFVHRSLFSYTHNKQKGRKTAIWGKKNPLPPSLSLSLSAAPTRSHPASTRANPADLTQILTQASRCERALGLLHHCIRLHMLS